MKEKTGKKMLYLIFALFVIGLSVDLPSILSCNDLLYYHPFYEASSILKIDLLDFTFA